MSGAPPNHDRPSALRRVAGNLTAMLAGLAFSLLLAEGLVRLLGYDPSPINPDPVVAARWRPGAHYRYRQEGFSEGRMNRAGWRDRDYPERKPAGTSRILFLGDSYVQALEVALDSTFHERLERALGARQAPGRRLEVLAMGRQGFGTTDEYLTYRTWGVRYDPDVVVLVFVLNDWGDNWKWDDQAWARPFLFLEGDSLRFDDRFRDTPEYRRLARLAVLKRHSALATLAARVYQDLRVRVRPNTAESGLIEASAGRGWFTEWNFDVSPSADSIPAFELTARILGRLAGEVQRDGRRFVLVVAGSAEMADHDLMATRAGDPNFDPDKTTRWLERTGERYGFEVLALAPRFRELTAAGIPRPWFGEQRRYGHWNDLGHAIAAAELARYFEAHPVEPRVPPSREVPGARR